MDLKDRLDAVEKKGVDAAKAEIRAEANERRLRAFAEDLRDGGPLNRMGTEDPLKVVDWIRRKATYMLEALYEGEPAESPIRAASQPPQDPPPCPLDCRFRTRIGCDSKEDRCPDGYGPDQYLRRSSTVIGHCPTSEPSESIPLIPSDRSGASRIMSIPWYVEFCVITGIWRLYGLDPEESEHTIIPFAEVYLPKIADWLVRVHNTDSRCSMCDESMVFDEATGFWKCPKCGDHPDAGSIERIMDMSPEEFSKAKAERAEASIYRLLRALEPFAEMLELPDQRIAAALYESGIQVGDIRRAKAAHDLATARWSDVHAAPVVPGDRPSTEREKTDG